MKKWEEIIKEKMDEPNGTLPESVFEEFHARLEASRSTLGGPAGRRGAKRRPLLWALVPAAAAGLAAVLFLRQPSAPQDAVQVIKRHATSVAVTPASTEPVQSLESVEPIEPAAAVWTPRPVSHTIAPYVEMQQPASLADDTESIISVGSAEETGGADRTDETTAFEPVVSPQTEDRSDNSLPESVFPAVSPDKPHDNAARPLTMKIAPAAGIVAGSGLLAAIVQSVSVSLLPADPSSNVLDYLGDLADGRYAGVSGWNKDEPTGELKHHPALFKGGLSVGIPLADRLKIVTGLEYSQYRSDVAWRFLTEYRWYEGDKEQIVRYLGIPLRLDWSLAKNNWLDVYVGAGAQADYCIGATLTDTHPGGTHKVDYLERDGFVFSLLAAGGVQVNANKRIGLYIEPVFVWTGGKPSRAEEIVYPESWEDAKLPAFAIPAKESSGLQTYRTEHPFMFSVSTGLRINLGK